MSNRTNILDGGAREAQLPAGVYRVHISCSSGVTGHCQIKAGCNPLADLDISGGGASETIRHPGGPISIVCDQAGALTVEIELPL